MTTISSDEFKQWRTRLGWSQNRAASELGVTNVTVYRWEKGTHKIPAAIRLALEQLEAHGSESPI